MSSSRRFKFSSPGIFLKEIDRSNLPAIPPGVGPTIIGRLPMGPGMRPMIIQSFDDYVSLFGQPEPGAGGGDQWRDGNSTGPTYAAYAAQAYLRFNGPINVIRLLGEESPNATAGAGEAGWVTRDPVSDDAKLLNSTTGAGAYGLFICDSGSSDLTHGTGTLAAVFYCGKGAPLLNGQIVGHESDTTASLGTFVHSVAGKPNTFRISIVDGTTAPTPAEVNDQTFEFNFTATDKSFVRRVFNTNPTLLNGTINASGETKPYWLGETFENDVVTTCTTGNQIGIILGLHASGSNAANKEQADYRFSSHEAKTPWVVSQHVGVADTKATDHSDVEKLFRLVSMKGGEWPSKHLKVSIANIKASRNIFDPYGRFDIIIRKSSDIDTNMEVMERFTNLSLNPKAPEYISKRIGDQYLYWSDTDAMFRVIGDNINRSNYFRVEVSDKVKNGGINKDLIPFGFYGPPRFKGFSVVGGSDDDTYVRQLGTDDQLDDVFIAGAGDLPWVEGSPIDVGVVDSSLTTFSASFQFPSLPLRKSTTEVSTNKPENVYFGIDTEISGTTLYNASYGDINRPAPNNVAPNDKSVPDQYFGEYAYHFTLDNISGTTLQAPFHAAYVEGSRKDEKSLTATIGLKKMLRRGHDSFTMPVIGGHDGLNISEQEPFGQHVLTDAVTEETNYAYYTVNRALSSVADKEEIEMNLLTVPGVINKNITKRMIDICETRGDSLAIIDLQGGYKPSTDDYAAEEDRLGNVATVIDTLDDRAIDSSYGCAYYPWVQIADRFSSDRLWAPPSVVALGTLGSSETRSELWFAPAGFVRGGLSNGVSGLNVLGVRQRLTSKERDELYEANINPIASFPAEGIVVFGQKTLQVTPSALDRINVRRLMIFIKREITRMARDILFDQNVTATWQRFLSRANPFLTNVKIRYGLTEFLVVLDDSTTTPDLIDRNIMYAKVYVKPARSIEYIAVDFVITNTGAEFS
ncbi:phage tail sheath C-terminal domain-containing protein [Luminiphilus sp.]|nr:phage tail sheath C-terminal domain-containing protein [Luminiphilus sp.]